MSDKTVARMTQAGLWLPLSGRFSPAELFEEGRAGVGDITLPGAGARTIVYRADSRGFPVPTSVTRAAPGQPSATLQNYIGFARDYLQKSRVQGTCAYAQVRLHECVDMDHPGGWDFVIHLGRTLYGDESIGSPVAREFNDGEITKELPAQPVYHVEMARPTLSAQTFAGAQNLTGIVFVDDPDACEGCEAPYPGPHKVGFITEEAVGGGTANVYYTKNGGTWAVTSAKPFLTNDEDPKYPVIRSLNKTQWRLIVGRIITDAGNPAEIAYSDVTKGVEETTAWTNVNVGSTNGDIVNSIYWPKLQQLFVGFGGGDIAFSDDQGATFAVEFTGSNAINKFFKRPVGGDIYAVGAADTLLRRRAGTTTWSALTGPNDGAIISITIANDGTIWVGANTSLWRSSTPLPTSTSHWTEVKDFGTNHSVIEISVKGGNRAFGGDSQLLHIGVQDGTGTNGDLWLTIDGGGYIEEIPDLSNAGYNAFWFSSLDPNIGWVVGDASGGAGIVHSIAPALGV
jgi:hypothetical protein